MIKKQTRIEIIVKIDQRLDRRLMHDPFCLLLLQSLVLLSTSLTASLLQGDLLAVCDLEDHLHSIQYLLKTPRRFLFGNILWGGVLRDVDPFFIDIYCDRILGDVSVIDSIAGHSFSLPPRF